MQNHLHSPFLLVISGVSGSGKTTMLKTWLAETSQPSTMLVSSDECRTLLADTDKVTHVNEEAFSLARYLIQERARLFKSSILDSTCLRVEDLGIAFSMADDVGLPCYHLFLDTTREQLAQFRANKPGLLPHVAKRQDFLAKDLRRQQQRGRLPRFIESWHVNSPEEGLAILRSLQVIPSVPRLPDPRAVIIGDVHSCADELENLLTIAKERYPEHKIVYIGDLFDRGPDPKKTLDLVSASAGYVIPGNHDLRIAKILAGQKPEEPWLQPEYMLTEATISTLKAAGVLEQATALFGQSSQLIIGDGKDTLVAVHAAVLANDAGRFNRAAQRRALYGLLDTKAAGAPKRQDWRGLYLKERGKFPVVCGHEVISRPEWRGNTINIDTGCVYGGALTALVWPEGELLQVKAAKTYCPGKEEIVQMAVTDPVFNLPNPERPLVLPIAQSEPVVIPSHKFKAALANTRIIAPWHLWFLAPTISPAPADPVMPDVLEHPLHAVKFYENLGIKNLVAQTKHMGSRATTLICRTPEIALANFGEAKDLVVWSRNGYEFFDEDLAVLAELRTQLKAGLDITTPDWEWVLLDGEMMPWTLKGAGLVTGYFLPTGAAQLAYRQYLKDHPPEQPFPGHTQSVDSLPAAEEYMKELYLYGRPPEADEWSYGIFNVLGLQAGGKRTNGFNWPAQVTEDFVKALHTFNPKRFSALNSKFIDTTNPSEVAELVHYWKSTWGSKEGIVIKPATVIPTCVPAVKVRNPGYLRIIYGVDYKEQLDLYRTRSVNQKLGASLKQYKVSTELLNGLIQGKPWTDMHQYALGFLALNSETLDPRL